MAKIVSYFTSSSFWLRCIEFQYFLIVNCLLSRDIDFSQIYQIPSFCIIIQLFSILLPLFISSFTFLSWASQRRQPLSMAGTCVWEVLLAGPFPSEKDRYVITHHYSKWIGVFCFKFLKCFKYQWFILIKIH